MIQSGKLRHKISIQSLVETQSSFGEPVQSWSSFTTNVWASIEPLKMQERFIADQFMSNVEKKITIRFTTGIEPKQRVINNSLSYDIESIINPDERNRELQLLVSRVNT
ncbi:MAG: phage head closure protein [Gammaproteobacteria bacterium]|nr:phage head closure protein [Gammaproteobacteria bacterium]